MTRERGLDLLGTLLRLVLGGVILPGLARVEVTKGPARKTDTRSAAAACTPDTPSLMYASLGSIISGPFRST